MQTYDGPITRQRSKGLRHHPYGGQTEQPRIARSSIAPTAVQGYSRLQGLTEEMLQEFYKEVTPEKKEKTIDECSTVAIGDVGVHDMYGSAADKASKNEKKPISWYDIEDEAEKFEEGDKNIQSPTFDILRERDPDLYETARAFEWKIERAETIDGSFQFLKEWHHAFPYTLSTRARAHWFWNFFKWIPKEDWENNKKPSWPQYPK